VANLAKIKAHGKPLQGHLDFGSADFAAESYVHSPQNAATRAALATWATWPGGTMALVGEPQSGKSHLGTLWAHSADAPILQGAELDLAEVGRLTEVQPIRAMIDHADHCDETALFALLTQLEHHGGAVLLIARTPPATWPFSLPDLKSRLASVSVTSLSAPEPDLLAALIIRHSAARGFKIDETASTYLANRIPRTFEATRDIVTCMQEVNSPSLKSPQALAQRALQALYARVDYEDETATPDLFDL
jgi:chromosomal replication initiation ATPase DnaA